MKIPAHPVLGLAITAAILAIIGLPAAHQAMAATDEETIRQHYIEWSQATNDKDIEAWAVFLAPNPIFVPPGEPALTTREAVLEFYRKSFQDPAFALDCEQTEIHVAGSNDMAWSRGYCDATFTAPGGEIAHGTSRWFKVWLKQESGVWRCRVNTWNYQDH